MTKLSISDIQKISGLARIELTDTQQEQMGLDVSSILDFVESLQKINTKDVKPTSQVTGLSDVWREDRVVECSISRQDLLSQAPEVQDGYVKVKKIL